MWVSALDVSDPSDPHTVWSAPAGLGTHGMGFTPDGDTMYMSTLAGVNILDTSAIQDRAQPGFTMHQLLPLRGDKHWADGEFTQHSVYVTYGGVPHIFTVDESGSGGVKLFDAADPRTCCCAMTSSYRSTCPSTKTDGGPAPSTTASSATTRTTAPSTAKRSPRPGVRLAAVGHPGVRRP